MMRFVAAFLLFAVLALGKASPLSVPYQLLVRGKRYNGSVAVKVVHSSKEVARGKASRGRIEFVWAPTDGEIYDLEIVAGRQRIAINDVKTREFYTDWMIELDFPPFQHTCGAEVPATDRSNVVRVDCVVFDDRKGDPPQRVTFHTRTQPK
jgi:hypothetical protein